jgi:hypothetical protein
METEVAQDRYRTGVCPASCPKVFTIFWKMCDDAKNQMVQNMEPKEPVLPELVYIEVPTPSALDISKLSHETIVMVAALQKLEREKLAAKIELPVSVAQEVIVSPTMKMVVGKAEPKKWKVLLYGVSSTEFAEAEDYVQKHDISIRLMSYDCSHSSRRYEGHPEFVVAWRRRGHDHSDCVKATMTKDWGVQGASKRVFDIHTGWTDVLQKLRDIGSRKS